MAVPLILPVPSPNAPWPRSLLGRGETVIYSHSATRSTYSGPAYADPAILEQPEVREAIAEAVGELDEFERRAAAHPCAELCQYPEVCRAPTGPCIAIDRARRGDAPA